MKTTLISFQRWLANKIHSFLNPIATLIESTTTSKGSGKQGDKSNKLKHDNKNHRLNPNSSQSLSGRPHIDDKKLKMLVLQRLSQNFRLYCIKSYSCR